MQKIETILTPALFPFRTMNDTHICVVNDILRATTSICTAISNGAKAIIPVRTIEQAKEYKEIVHSTTNGTVAISIAREGNPQEIVIGAFCNLSCLSDYLVAKGKDVQIFCSGWKNTPALEDTVFAGALAEKLLQSGKFENKNDSTNLALALWREAKSDLRAYMEKASHIHRLRKYHMDDVFDYTFQIDTCNVVPKLEQNKIVGVVQ